MRFSLRRGGAVAGRLGASPPPRPSTVGPPRRALAGTRLLQPARQPCLARPAYCSGASPPPGDDPRPWAHLGAPWRGHGRYRRKLG
jgi:hypothetical protein